MYVKRRNAYKQLIKNKQTEYRQNKTKAIVENLGDSKIFWKQIRSLMFKPQIQNNIEKNAWVQHFKRIYSNDASDNVLQMPIPSPLLDGDADFEYLESEITPDEIRRSIKSLKTGKAPGPDTILNEMIICSADCVVHYLTKLFNAILDNGTFPSLWSKSVIVPLHKGGPFDVLENYRGISLTSTLSKVFLHIVNDRLQTWAEDKNLIGEEQAGFRKGYATTDNIFVLNSLIQKYLSRHKKLFICFVDFKRAFDSVSRKALGMALEYGKICGKIGQVIKSMYESVQCCIRCPEGNSEYFECTSGLKQGCKTSPVIFSFLMSIVSNMIIQKGKHGVQIMANDTELFTLLFADDLVLLSDTVPGLQNQLNTLKEASDYLGLTVNSTKTKIVVFRHGGYLAAHEKWYLGNERLEVSTQYKYLGVILSTRLCTNTILSDLVRRAKAASMQIIRSLRKLAFVKPEVVFKIFDSQVQPILLYGSEIWGLNSCKPIESVQMYMLKWLLNVDSRTPNTMIYGETGRYPLRINAALRSVKYWLRILRMDSERYPHKIYEMMKDSMRNQSNWASGIKDLLLQYGFEGVWSDQGVHNDLLFTNLLRERMIAKFKTDWMHDVQNSDRYSFYRQLKCVPYLEQYICALDKKVSKDAVTRFRLGISDLYIHKNRYSSTPCTTLCPLCWEEEEDEHHFLFYCPALYDLREKYILPHIVVDSTNDQLRSLFTTTENNVMRSVSMYLGQGFRRRSIAVEYPEQVCLNV
ncbi:MAG: hypothetical protein DSZ28_02380 [Thiothrix sp.]|nr:MAG: hypothetical protein DSZ28_02380 [Thiothrix sp.]